jgi:pseudouridine kinase
MKRPHLVAAGAAHVDRRGQVSGPYVPAASNPGTMREEVGGGAFNAVRSAIRHGVSAAMLSLRGGDLAADTVAQAIVAAGAADLSATFLDRTTPSYTAILDRDGELVTGFADMALYEFGFLKQVRRRKFRDALEPADALLLDANMPAQAIERALDHAARMPAFAIAISPAKAVRLAGVLARLGCLFANMREARTLAGDAAASPVEAVLALRTKGLSRAVVTDGGRPIVAFDQAGLFTIAPPAVPVADVTGAGDAMAGATIAMLMRGMPYRDAVRHGAAAAALTVGSQTVVAYYSDDDFASTLALVGEAEAVA